MKIQGFTLLETIIYVALFSMLMTGVLVTVYELIESGTHNRMAVAIQEEGTFVNRKLSWALSGATVVTTPDAQTLVITHPSGIGYPHEIKITESAEQMQLSREGAAPQPLTTSEFKIENTNFSVEPPSTGLPTKISVRYEIEGMPFVFNTYLRY
jgi:Tfp pilus assembly protein PilE